TPSGSSSGLSVRSGPCGPERAIRGGCKTALHEDAPSALQTAFAGRSSSCMYFHILVSRFFLKASASSVMSACGRLAGGGTRGMGSPKVGGVPNGRRCFALPLWEGPTAFHCRRVLARQRCPPLGGDRPYYATPFALAPGLRPGGAVLPILVRPACGR